MEKFNEVYQLLLEKKELFSRYESTTRAILSCDVERLDETIELVDARQNMITQIDEISAKIREIIKDTTSEKHMLELIANNCDASNLNNEEQMIYYTAQETFASMNSAYRLEQNAIDMIEDLKESVLEKIKKSNREEGQKAKYMQGLMNIMGSASTRRGSLGKA